MEEEWKLDKPVKRSPNLVYTGHKVDDKYISYDWQLIEFGWEGQD